MIDTNLILLIVLNDLAMLAAYFLASAAKQGKLGLAGDLAKAVSEWSPGGAVSSIVTATVDALRRPGGTTDASTEANTEETEEIPVLGPEHF